MQRKKRYVQKRREKNKKEEKRREKKEIRDGKNENSQSKAVRKIRNKLKYNQLYPHHKIV